jgi:hypothetical protein
VRSSDRWLTPGVLITLILCATVCTLGVIGGVMWLTERGIDPDPMLKLAAQALAAVGGLGSFVVTLASRRTMTKVERNTGHLENAVYAVHDALPRPVPARHEATVWMQSAAPAPVRE